MRKHLVDAPPNHDVAREEQTDHIGTPVAALAMMPRPASVGRAGTRQARLAARLSPALMLINQDRRPAD
jgi:hypothetical protein